MTCFQRNFFDAYPHIEHTGLQRSLVTALFRCATFVAEVWPEARNEEWFVLSHLVSDWEVVMLFSLHSRELESYIRPRFL